MVPDHGFARVGTMQVQAIMPLNNVRRSVHMAFALGMPHRLSPTTPLFKRHTGRTWTSFFSK